MKQVSTVGQAGRRYARMRLQAALPRDETYPVPREIFPTGKRTARHGLVVRRSAQDNRPLEPVAMEWGFPTKVPSKRDPAV